MLLSNTYCHIFPPQQFTMKISPFNKPIKAGVSYVSRNCRVLYSNACMPRIYTCIRSSFKIHLKNRITALFSKSDLTITGSGTLNVTSDFNDGITSRDSLKITDGTIAVKSKADGIVGRDVAAIKEGTITIDAGKDSIRSANDTDEGPGNILIAGGTLAVSNRQV
jgi:hypothetical protein